MNGKLEDLKPGDRVVFVRSIGRVTKVAEGKFWAKFPELEDELEFLDDGRRHEWQRGPVVRQLNREAA